MAKIKFKFRGKVLNEDRFIRGVLWQYTDGTCSIANNQERQEVEPESLAQLIGYDADGKEIYTGDCVVHEKNPNVKALAKRTPFFEVTDPPKDLPVIFEVVPSTYSPKHWRLAEND